MTNIFANLQAETEKQQQVVDRKQSPATSSKTLRKKKPTSNPTQARDIMREMPRDMSSEVPRENSRDLPTRDEIQEFSFRLRDELKVKVQAEVPHQWQSEWFCCKKWMSKSRRQKGAKQRSGAYAVKPNSPAMN